MLKQFNNNYDKPQRNEKHYLRAPSNYDSKMLLRRRSSNKMNRKTLKTQRNSTRNITCLRDIYDPKNYLATCLGHIIVKNKLDNV